MGKQKVVFQVRKCDCRDGIVCGQCRREIAEMIFWRRLETFEILGGHQPQTRRMPKNPQFLDRW